MTDTTTATDTPEVWLTPAEAAKHSGYAYGTIHRALRDRTLPGRQNARNKKWKIRQDVLDRWADGEQVA